MPIWVIVLLVIAVILFLPGLFFGALELLIWIGIAVAVIALIGWLLSNISGNKRL